MKKLPLLLCALLILLFPGCSLVKAIGYRTNSLSKTPLNSLTETSLSTESSTVSQMTLTTVSDPSPETPPNTRIEMKLNLYANGILINSKYILNDKLYCIPAEDISKSIGCDYHFDSETNILTFFNADTKCKMVVGSGIAKVNHLNIACPAPFIKDKVVYAPLNFVCEQFACKAVISIYSFDYESDNSIYIFSPNTMDFGNKLGKIKSDIDRETYGTYSTYQEIFYDIALPEFSGLKDKSFQKKLNSIFTTIRKSIINDIANASKDTKSIGYYSELSYSIKCIHNGVMSVVISGDYYSGGAHSLQSLSSYNIDFNNNKIIRLKDLFCPSSDFKTRLLSEIKKVWNGGTGEYGGVELPGSLDGENFYLENGNVVFYYNPYELACYARGFVYFKIPLKNVSSILNSHYKTLIG